MTNNTRPWPSQAQVTPKHGVQTVWPGQCRGFPSTGAEDVPHFTGAQEPEGATGAVLEGPLNERPGVRGEGVVGGQGL